MSQTTAAPETLGAAQKDEIEGVNEILLKLLSTYNNISTPARPIVARRARTLSGPTIGNSGEGGHLSDAGHPIMIQYPFMPHHHGSPMNSKNPPNWLPPIGVFWDIENCQVRSKRTEILGYRWQRFLWILWNMEELNTIFCFIFWCQCLRDAWILCNMEELYLFIY